VYGSFHSELAARHAVAIASSCGGQLVVLAVDIGEVKREELSSGVEPLCQQSKTYGVLARGIIRKGDVVETIIEVINEENADLLVSSTRRSEYRLFVRRITQKLMLKALCSVLAVKPAGLAKRGKSLLLPMARRELATSELIMLTSNIAKSYSYKVEIFHMMEHQRWYNLAWNKLYTMRHNSEENMMPIANALKELGVDVDVRAVVAESSLSEKLIDSQVKKKKRFLLNYLLGDLYPP
jgi:nucleotide-binding universal stress UspA family protein